MMTPNITEPDFDFVRKRAVIRVNEEYAAHRFAVSRYEWVQKGPHYYLVSRDESYKTLAACPTFTPRQAPLCLITWLVAHACQLDAADLWLNADENGVCNPRPTAALTFIGAAPEADDEDFEKALENIGKLLESAPFPRTVKGVLNASPYREPKIEVSHFPYPAIPPVPVSFFKEGIRTGGVAFPFGGFPAFDVSGQVIPQQEYGRQLRGAVVSLRLSLSVVGEGYWRWSAGDAVAQVESIRVLIPPTGVDTPRGDVVNCDPFTAF